VTKVRFHEDARLELLEQAAYYEAAQPAVGQRFLIEVEHAVQLAARVPLLGAPFKFGTRRVFTKRFPFAVVYLVREDEMVILAIAHFRKKPFYWRGRKTEG